MGARSDREEAVLNPLAGATERVSSEQEVQQDNSSHRSDIQGFDSNRENIEPSANKLSSNSSSAVGQKISLLTIIGTSIGCIGIDRFLIYSSVKQQLYNIIMNNISNLDASEKAALIEKLLQNEHTANLIYENIRKSPCHVKKFIESFSVDINQIPILGNAIASSEVVKKQIAIFNPKLVGDLEQYAKYHE